MSEWYQQALTPPEVVELRIRLGVIVDTDHAQVLSEVYEPLTGVLVAQWSIPAARADSWSALLDQAVEKARQQLADAIEPF